MRALRILLIVAVVLGGLFIAADRLAVGFAEDEAAERIRTREGLEQAPEVSIKGFPFLTQVAGGVLDEVDARMTGLEASAGGKSLRIGELTATLREVEFSSDFSTATAGRATGTARIAYDQLLGAAEGESEQLGNGITAKVTGLSDGGKGKVKVDVEIGTPIGDKTVSVLSSVSVRDGDTVEVRADTLPAFGLSFAEKAMREVTDFEQRITGLPAGIELAGVEARSDGVAISVTGRGVQLVG